MKATEIFTPGRLPTHTYVGDHLQERAKELQQALDTGALVISLSGPSKSGKTVFVETNVGRDRLVQVTGAGVNSPEKLWDRVFDLIGTPTVSSSSNSKGFDGKVGGKVGGSAGVFVKGQGEVSVEGAWSNSQTTTESDSVDYLQLLIRELSGTGLVVFVDDFHYIPLEVQKEISNQIKEAARQNVIFIVASVPYHSDDAVRANPDLRGRLVKLDFDYWDQDQLVKIAHAGFKHLNATLPEGYLNSLAAEAAGSPQLMQTLCLNTCFELDIEAPFAVTNQIETSDVTFHKICGRTAANSDYSSTTIKMSEGPKTRGQDRKHYQLRNGTICDVYPLILKAVADNPPELTIRYANLQDRIGRQCASEVPSGSSVTGACSHIASIANESENRAILEWDTGSDVLDIRDPYLLFFLRWGHRHS